MPKKDFTQVAFDVVQQATGEAPKPPATATDKKNVKNQAATDLGRLGGQKGGAARAAKLTPQQRSDIAKKAADKRWGGVKPPEDAAEVKPKRRAVIRPLPDDAN